MLSVVDLGKLPFQVTYLVPVIRKKPTNFSLSDFLDVVDDADYQKCQLSVWPLIIWGVGVVDSSISNETFL